MNGANESVSNRMRIPNPLRARSRSSTRKQLGITGIVTLLVAIHAPAAVAQDGQQNLAIGALGISAVQMRPVGGLGAKIGLGYGVAGSFLLPLDSAGMVSIRADAGISQYGSDARRTAFRETAGGRVEVDVLTNNLLETGSLGMQLTRPAGAIRPYIHTGATVLGFFTESSVEPTSGRFALASTVNQWDVAVGWTLGGGLYVPLRTGSSPVMLDVGAQYVHGGTAEYLAPESIVELPDGEIAVSPLESRAHMVTLRLGVRFGR